MHQSSMPLMVEIQGIFDEKFWNSLSKTEQAELIHTVVKGMEIANRPLYIVGNGSLGAPILDEATATQYNIASARGQKSALPWSVEDTTIYSGPGDKRLARDVYCFQHYAEKLIGKVPAEAAAAADSCDPSKRVAQLYNRDGMIGDRTQQLLENYASTNGKLIEPNKSIPDGSPLHALADQLIASLFWEKLEDAIDRGKATERAGTPPVPPPAAPPASDMGAEYVQLYTEQGRTDLIGANPSSPPSAPPELFPSIPKSSTPPAPDAPKDNASPAVTAPKKSAAASTDEELAGTDWTTVGLIAGGIVAVGAALYFTRPKKKKQPVQGIKLRLPHK